MSPVNYRCFNPFELLNHRRTRGIRKISNEIANKWKVSNKNSVCNTCRKLLMNKVPLNEPNPTSKFCEDEQVEDDLMKDNDFIPTVNVIKTGKSADSEILEQLKQKFNDPSTPGSIKTMILTIAPKSWSENRLANEFGISRRQAKNAKELVKKYGIMSTQNSREGRKMEPKTETLVKDFYLREDNSRVMPGKKDFVSIKKDDGKREHIQKQLILCNVKELFQNFKLEYPDVKVGITKFFTLRPKQCVLAGASGTHLVCVCTYHQNVKLMLIGGDIARLTANTKIHLTSYKDCLQKMMCTNPTPACQLTSPKSPKNESCKSCPGFKIIQDHLEMVFDENQIKSVTFEAWIGTDRSSFTTQLLPIDDFVDRLCAGLNVLKPHAYIVDQQASFFRSLKEKLVNGEVMVQCDFAENYCFVVQDASQSFHWNNNQATLLTCVFYFNKEEKVKHESIVMVTDDLKHDTATFYKFQKILHRHFDEKSLPVSKLFYVTDGASQHFKNRFNFLNLFYYKQDFNKDAELHFHATAHGKGPCDGIGGNLKRLASRASLQLPPEKAITTPERLYKWARKTLTETSIYYCSKEEIQQERIFLENRFVNASPIPGTKQLHAFIPTFEGILVKKTSNSLESKLVKIIK